MIITEKRKSEIAKRMVEYLVKEKGFKPSRTIYYPRGQRILNEAAQALGLYEEIGDDAYLLIASVNFELHNTDRKL